MGVPGVGAGQDERDFARDGDSQTLRGNKNEYRQVAIDLNEMADIHRSHHATGDGPAKSACTAPDCHFSMMFLEDEGTMTTDDLRSAEIAPCEPFRYRGGANSSFRVREAAIVSMYSPPVPLPWT